MLRVYNYMVCGLLLTGILAVVVAQASVVTNEAGQVVAQLVGGCRAVEQAPDHAGERVE